MKTKEIIALLQSRLPLFTDRFSDSSEVTSLISSGTTVSAVIPAHGASVGDQILIKGSQSNISASSIARVGIVGTLITIADHDVTNGLETIDLGGSVEAEFNGEFTIINVDNRRTIRFLMTDSGATVATGDSVLIDGESVFRGYNGLQTVSVVVDPDSLKYELDTTASDLEAASGTITMEKGIRISGAANVETLIEAYTVKPPTSFWLFAVLSDVTASKSRNIQNDAVDSLNRAQQGDGYRQQIIQPVTFYLFIPTSTQLAAREARDDAEEIFAALCGSILFAKIDSGLASGRTGAINFVNHGFSGYNKAFYIHQYSFEQLVDLTFQDTIGYDDDRAFRDISLLMKQTGGNETFSAEIDLDDEAL